jgi:hypothetical protein
VYRGGDFRKLADFHAGPATNFRGPTQVALGDMTGDHKAELVVSGRYANGSRQFGFRGTSLRPGLTPGSVFTAFTLGGAYLNGLYLALGDANGDGRADLVLGSGVSATPTVRVYSGPPLVQSNTRTLIANFTPAGSSSTNGVRVAVRDIDGDGRLDILTSSGELVSAFRGGSGLPASGLPPLVFAFDPDTLLNGGVWIG